MTALTISSNIISSADIAQDAPESAGAGDDLILNAGVLVASSGGNVTLTAGDDVLIHGTASASGKALSVVAGSNDADGRGAITIDGAASAANVSLAARSGIAIAGRLTATAHSTSRPAAAASPRRVPRGSRPAGCRAMAASSATSTSPAARTLSRRSATSRSRRALSG